MNVVIVKRPFSDNDQLIQKLVESYTFSSVTDITKGIRKSYQIAKIASIKSIKSFELKEIIKGYSSLQRNWDSYDADPISKTAINLAFEVLNELEKDDIFSSVISINVFPMRNGGVQFEFDAENISAELEIDSEGGMQFILFDAEGNIDKINPLFDYELSELSFLLEDSILNAA